jgi:hypothetical protein
MEKKEPLLHTEAEPTVRLEKGFFPHLMKKAAAVAAGICGAKKGGKYCLLCPQQLVLSRQGWAAAIAGRASEARFGA